MKLSRIVLIGIKYAETGATSDSRNIAQRSSWMFQIRVVFCFRLSASQSPSITIQVVAIELAYKLMQVVKVNLHTVLI